MIIQLALLIGIILLLLWHYGVIPMKSEGLLPMLNKANFQSLESGSFDQSLIQKNRGTLKDSTGLNVNDYLLGVQVHGATQLSGDTRILEH